MVEAQVTKETVRGIRRVQFTEGKLFVVTALTWLESSLLLETKKCINKMREEVEAHPCKGMELEMKIGALTNEIWHCLARHFTEMDKDTGVPMALMDRVHPLSDDETDTLVRILYTMLPISPAEASMAWDPLKFSLHQESVDKLRERIEVILGKKIGD